MPATARPQARLSGRGETPLSLLRVLGLLGLHVLHLEVDVALQLEPLFASNVQLLDHLDHLLVRAVQLALALQDLVLGIAQGCGRLFRLVLPALHLVPHEVGARL